LPWHAWKKRPLTDWIRRIVSIPDPTTQKESKLKVKRKNGKMLHHLFCAIVALVWSTLSPVSVSPSPNEKSKLQNTN
jgi:hypothetical protein